MSKRNWDLHIIQALFVVLLALMAATLISTRIFVRVQSTTVSESGKVTLERTPIIDGITLRVSQEVSTIDGRTCQEAPRYPPYEKVNKVITYQLGERLMPCVEVGATYRVNRKFGLFRSFNTETEIK